MPNRRRVIEKNMGLFSKKSKKLTEEFSECKMDSLSVSSNCSDRTSSLDQFKNFRPNGRKGAGFPAEIIGSKSIFVKI